MFAYRPGLFYLSGIKSSVTIIVTCMFISDQRSQCWKKPIYNFIAMKNLTEPIWLCFFLEKFNMEIPITAVATSKVITGKIPYLLSIIIVFLSGFVSDLSCNHSRKHNVDHQWWRVTVPKLSQTQVTVCLNVFYLA